MRSIEKGSLKHSHVNNQTTKMKHLVCKNHACPNSVSLPNKWLIRRERWGIECKPFGVNQKRDASAVLSSANLFSPNLQKLIIMAEV
jgi:hypothetical protein